jgi:hypothetical protein
MESRSSQRSQCRILECRATFPIYFPVVTRYKAGCEFIGRVPASKQRGEKSGNQEGPGGGRCSLGGCFLGGNVMTEERVLSFVSFRGKRGTAGK